MVIRLGDKIERDDLPVVITADGPIVAERGLYRIGGGGISQAIGIPLAEHLVIPDPVEQLTHRTEPAVTAVGRSRRRRRRP